MKIKVSDTLQLDEDQRCYNVYWAHNPTYNKYVGYAGNSAGGNWAEWVAFANEILHENQQKEEPKKTPLFTLTSEQLDAIEYECDDDCGLLVKSSTLRYVIEKAVNDDRKAR